MYQYQVSKIYFLLFVHHVIIISLTISNNLNLLEFLGLNFSLGVTLISAKLIIDLLYTTWVGRVMGHNIDFRKLGSWAVVTGATDGIGLAYCVELAKQGINIVLMSRSIDKLNNCALRLEKRFKIKTIVIEIDFSGEVDKYEQIFPQLQGLEVGTLINNVGMTYPRPTRFDEIFYKPGFVRDIINLNVVAVTMMTGAVLPGMVQRGKGAVINVGSMISCFGGPYFTLYSSTKCYMERFTSDLAMEFRDSGLIFQYQSPGYVATKISRVKPSLACPTPEEYAAKGINMVGLTEETSVWMLHRLFFMGFKSVQFIMPESLIKNILAYGARSFWLFAKKKELEKQNLVFLARKSDRVIVGV